MNQFTRKENDAISEQPLVLPPDFGRAARRQARVLIGWMPHDKAVRILAGRDGSTRDPDIVNRVGAARRAVAERVGSFTGDGAISDIPDVLADHAARVMERPEFAAYRRDGWKIRMADLRKVCAVQEIVHLEHAVKRFDGIAPDDIESIARICLPLEADASAVKLHWSEENRYWMLSSDNPNLNISAHFSESQEVGGGRTMPGYGFCAEAQPSFVQVVRHRGRYILRDGYHRTLGLVARGVTRIPVAYREFDEFESLCLDHGNLAEPTYLGNNPATMFDYLDDEVAAETSLSVKKTLVIIEAKRYTISL
jgi:hypothetical protein